MLQSHINVYHCTNDISSFSYTVEYFLRLYENCPLLREFDIVSYLLILWVGREKITLLFCNCSYGLFLKLFFVFVLISGLKQQL